MLTQFRGVVAYALTPLPEGGADHPDFLKSLLKQVGHLRKCFMTFVAIPWSCGLQMQCRTFLLGSKQLSIDFLGRKALLETIG